MCGQRIDLGTTENKSSKWPHGERDSASEALTTRPRYLLLLHCTYGGPATMSRQFQFPHGNLNLHTAIMKFKALTICTEISVEDFRQMVLVFFFLAPKRGTGLRCTIYKIPVKFSVSLDMKPGTSNPKKWYRKFRFGKNGKKVIPRKVLTFFPENFHRDEPFHLNSPRNFRVFHTNDKRSKISHDNRAPCQRNC